MSKRMILDFFKKNERKKIADAPPNLAVITILRDYDITEGGAGIIFQF